MHYFCSFLLGLFCAFACAQFAKKRGRNPTYWFIGGLFFGLLALGALFLLPPLRVPVVRPPVKTPIALLQATVQTQVDKFWYYLDQEKNQVGPMSFEALSKAWQGGSIRENSLVWNEELEQWKRLDEVTSVLRHIV